MVSPVVVSVTQTPQSTADPARAADHIIDAANRALSAGAHMVVTPELALSSYCSGDDFFEPSFASIHATQLQRVIDSVEVPLLLGTVLPTDFPLLADGVLDPSNDSYERAFVNAYVLVVDHEIVSVVVKHNLPTYGIFDERRWFVAGSATQNFIFSVPTAVGVVNVGVGICEDLWGTQEFGILPALRRQVRDTSAAFVVCPSASPYHVGKLKLRHNTMGVLARLLDSPIVYVNTAGAVDGIVFDGRSFIDDGKTPHTVGDFLSASTQEVDVATGRVIGPAAVGGKSCAADGFTFTTPGAFPVFSDASPEAEVFSAASFALRTYVDATTVSGLVVGLSGGLDSSVVAVIAAHALGPDRVTGVLMPSKFSSDHSLADAHGLVEALGISAHVCSIAQAHEIVSALVAGVGFDTSGVVDENIQARVRGLLLCTVANSSHGAVVGTSNKSEIACGYSTLYGDSVSFTPTPISDMFKTTQTYADGAVLPGVFDVARWINDTFGELVPQNVIDKPPSAELSVGQVDSATLGDYDYLDRVLFHLVDEFGDVDSAHSMLVHVFGFSDSAAAEFIARTTRLIRIARFKRYQFAPSVKLSKRNFASEYNKPIS